jgi:hypothetical protein
MANSWEGGTDGPARMRVLAGPFLAMKFLAAGYPVG